ncbi:aminotransferase class I/II-fold pyridoxal phosphate-dependent enzyme [Pseudomonas sp. NPDC007930]|uniref:aminotransferase class I/II-fold pyridoxal phosphate-dependent enzyme n=1 Tax=Pseudomonas sp. NPDC007930 TaxID=3364417 RepID=UPI0036E6427D
MFVDPQWLAGHIKLQGSDGIVATLAHLIESGRLAHGARLPTVRDFALELGVSPSTVATAWSVLRGQGLIDTQRRRGTLVTRQAQPAPPPPSNWLHAAEPSWSFVDLARGSGDPALQPGLAQALQAGLEVAHLHAAEQAHIIPELRDAVAPTWPCTPQRWSTTGGSTEGILLALQVTLRAGDKVAIENPTSPRLLSLLTLLKVEPIAVACDQHGPIPQALAEALKQAPKAFVLQLRAQVPTGFAVTRGRRDALAAVLQEHPEVQVIEDDHLGLVSDAPAYSLSEPLPDRSLLVRAYCRAFGVDLRMSIIGGSARLIEAIEAYRSDRVAITSRILQGALANLLVADHAVATLANARAAYARRRHQLFQALQTRGLALREGSGLALWLPVEDETSAIVNLATQGVVLGSGSPCFVGSEQRAHVRVAISRLPDDPARIDALAGLIAAGIKHPRREDFE